MVLRRLQRSVIPSALPAVILRDFDLKRDQLALWFERR